MCFDTTLTLCLRRHIVSAASSETGIAGALQHHVLFIFRENGGRYNICAKHGVVCRQRKEPRKGSQRTATAFRRSSKRKIRKDPCLSHNENHGLIKFYASLHLKCLWREPSSSDQRQIN